MKISIIGAGAIGGLVGARLAVAGEEMSHFRKYQYAIVNVDLEASVEALKTVIRASRLRTCRLRESAETILSTFQTHKEN